MNKPAISNPAFIEDPQEPSSIGFNLISTVNNFNSIFDPKSLDPQEEIRIQKLLFENFQLNGDSEDKENAKLSEDFQQIKALTSEIKGIQKQSLVLIGERINKARLIFKSYKEGAFTKWLKEAFSSKQTGYNILAYYLFFTSLPVEFQESFKRLPQKTAYLLASREGDLAAKLEILKDPSLGTENILAVIREKLPLSSNDKRQTKGQIALLINALLKTTEKLYVSKEPIQEEWKETIQTVRSLLDEILLKHSEE